MLADHIESADAVASHVAERHVLDRLVIPAIRQLRTNRERRQEATVTLLGGPPTLGPERHSLSALKCRKYHAKIFLQAQMEPILYVGFIT